MRAKKCLVCSKRTFFNRGSHDECTSCEFVGWSWKHTDEALSTSNQTKCPNCTFKALLVVKTLETGQTVRRCRACEYCAVEPALKPTRRAGSNRSRKGSTTGATTKTASNR